MSTDPGGRTPVLLVMTAFLAGVGMGTCAAIKAPWWTAIPAVVVMWACGLMCRWYRLR